MVGKSKRRKCSVDARKIVRSFNFITEGSET